MLVDDGFGGTSLPAHEATVAPFRHPDFPDAPLPPALTEPPAAHARTSGLSASTVGVTKSA